ncbi:MAG TPA: SH3 domain-containing protein [Limnochordia bacterium]|nr:SH3 domain-containing protein [Limnochordia bacterium]
MNRLWLTIRAAAVTLTSTAARAAPAYVASTVNLRADVTTSSENLAKIPRGSLVDVTDCSEWCRVEWQGRTGYAIASALDRSGRVPSQRAAAPRRYAPEVYEYEPGPYDAAPAPYYYGYRPYWGYRPTWGYRYHRWRRW